MFKKSSKGFYFWEEFLELGFVSGFSTKEFGDLSRGNPKYSINLESFCKALEVNKNQVVGMEQIHGDKVGFVSEKNSDSVIPQADGLISLNSNVYLICKSADCVPVLLFDRIKKTFGIAHAGWRGAYNEIAKILVSKMADKGSKTSNILVGIGPSIRDCCYVLDKDRIKAFVDKFSRWQEKIVRSKGTKLFLSLQNLIRLQFIESGVNEENIKDSMICTKDNASEFYSYRGESEKDSTCRFVGIIGTR